MKRDAQYAAQTAIVKQRRENKCDNKSEAALYNNKKENRDSTGNKYATSGRTRHKNKRIMTCLQLLHLLPLSPEQPRSVSQTRIGVDAVETAPLRVASAFAVSPCSCGDMLPWESVKTRMRSRSDTRRQWR